MADPRKIENAIKRVRNQKAFIQELLIDALGWDIDERAEDVEDISFEWSAEELRTEGLDKHIVDGTIRQIGPDPKMCHAAVALCRCDVTGCGWGGWTSVLPFN